jgi:menaquinone-9 beta-reductase
MYEMAQEREVIVVGAGPAGATAATLLAQKGHDVLLLDRQSFPRDKICGDGVPAGVIKMMNRMGMGAKVLAAEKSGDFNPIKQVRLVSPRGFVMDAPLPDDPEANSYVAPRKVIDALLQEHAVACGTEFLAAQVQEPLLENGQVVGVRARLAVNGRFLTQDLHARLVIGADGVTSAIARALRPRQTHHHPEHKAVALRAYIEDIEEIPHTAEFYFYEAIAPGYAWIFNLGGGRANIGLGMRLDQFRQTSRKLEDLLKEFLAMPEIRKRLKQGGQLRDMATWPLNFGSQEGLRFAFPGALLVGDAAGFINPITGGGIHNGMISAELAAKSAHEALTVGSFVLSQLQVYEQRCRRALWPGLHRSYKYQRLLQRFPSLIDLIIKQGREGSQFAQTFMAKL